MNHQRKAFQQYKRAVCVLGVGVFLGALIWGRWNVHDLGELAIFLALIFLAEYFPIRLPQFSDMTMTMPAVVGLFLSHGPSSTIVVGSVGIFAANIIIHLRQEHPLRWLLGMVSYNTAAYVLSVAAASLAYALAAGTTLVAGRGVTLGEVVFPLMLWVAVCTTANMALFTVGLSMVTREPWRKVGAENLRWFIPNYLMTAPSGILFAYLYLEYGWHGVVLVIVPFVVGRQAMNQYTEQMDAYRETITTLGSYMQHYHPYTRGHLERVAGLADRLAKEIQLPLRSLVLMHDAGMLHDIGKVGVDEQILDKVGQLSDKDWAVIKLHPARGAEILAQMKYLEPIVPWVRGHHERPDGTGYPEGLHDGEIPLEAAVIAVADAFDAMTGSPDEKGRRVYRAPLTLDQAVDQVRYGTGTQFDPRVVKAFMQVMAREERQSAE